MPRKPVGKNSAPANAPKAEGEATPTAAADPAAALGRTGTVVWADMTALNEELMAFGQRRLEVNMAHNQSLLECRSLEDLYRVQSEFAASAARQYIDESGRLMGLMTKLVMDCWTPGGLRA